MSVYKNEKAQAAHLINFPAYPGNENKPAVQHKRNIRYLWLYVIGIFSISIVLMLLSFLSHSQRAEQQHLDFSLSALQSIDTLKYENDSLKQENSDLLLTKNALLDQIDDLQYQLDTLLQSNDALRTELNGAEDMLANSAKQREELIKQLEQHND